jgi:hypothetical protein
MHHLTTASRRPGMAILSELCVQESPAKQIIANNFLLVNLHFLDIPCR